MITKPGIFDGIPDATYHADNDLAPELGRSLSASGAKTLLKLPARFNYERTHRRPSKPAFDLGHLAHALILGTGADIWVSDCTDWRAKAMQVERKAKEAEGFTVVNRDDLRQASAMARAVRLDPTAGPMFREGKAEQSLYWIDEQTGVTLRGRTDWLHPRAIVDLKTCIDASPEGFGKAAYNFAYPVAAAHYVEGVRVLTGQTLPFVWVAVETTAPHHVATYYATADDLAYGRERMRQAIDLYAQCESTDTWPAYNPEITPLQRPLLGRLRSQEQT